MPAGVVDSRLSLVWLTDNALHSLLCIGARLNKRNIIFFYIFFFFEIIYWRVGMFIKCKLIIYKYFIQIVIFRNIYIHIITFVYIFNLGVFWKGWGTEIILGSWRHGQSATGGHKRQVAGCGTATCVVGRPPVTRVVRGRSGCGAC